MKQHTPTPTLVYRIPQAARLLAMGRSSEYRLVDAGELELVKIGLRSSAITRASLVKFADARSIPLPDGPQRLLDMKLWVRLQPDRHAPSPPEGESTNPRPLR